LRPIIRSMQGALPLSTGLVWLSVMVVTGAIAGAIQQHSLHVGCWIGRRFWCAVVTNLFTKPSRLDTTTFKDCSESQIVSLIGQDASMFPYIGSFFPLFISGPLQALVTGVVAFYFLGVAFLAGLAVLLLLFLSSHFAASSYKKTVVMKHEQADARMMVINETLQGIRSVKLCGWEAPLEHRIAAARREELRLLLLLHLLYALQQGLVAIIPVAVAVVTFVTHAAMGRSFDLQTVLMGLGSIEQLSNAFLIVPNAIMYGKMFSASFTRFGRVLLQRDTYTPPSGSGGTEAVTITGASFQWDMEAPRPSLSDVSLTVANGELVVVVGRVASGKSTLAAGVFGLVRRVKGEVVTQGTCAYVPQDPQILNASVRGNIVFGSAFNEESFSSAIGSCCLEADLDQFADGDLTEIGEKGITISGGQRARVALARALYSGANIAVLDDPLSAMDANIGRSVFQKCILSHMCGSGMAVLLLTNQVHLGKFANRILVLDDGEVKESGTFNELMLTGGLFAQLYASVTADADEPTAVGDAAPRSSETLPLSGSCPTEEPVVQANPAASQKTTEMEASGEAALEGPRASLNRNSAMTLEKHHEGRIGPKAFFRLSRSGRSGTLGVVLATCIVCAPFSMFAANIFLNAWVVASLETEPLSNRVEMTLYLASGVLFAATSFGRVAGAAMYFVRISAKLHERMIASVLRQTMVWYDTTPLGRILNRCSQDVALLDLQLPRVLEFTAQHVGTVFVGVFGGTVLVWPSLVLTIPLFLFLYVVLTRYGAVSLDLQRLMLAKTSPVMSQVSSFLTAMDTIRAFGKADVFREEFFQTTRNFNCVYYWIHVLDRVSAFFLVAVVAPLVSLILGGMTLMLRDSGWVSADYGGLAVALSSSLATRIPVALWCTVTLEKFFGGAQRVAEYAELVWEGSKVDWQAWEAARTAAQDDEAPWPTPGSLEFRDVELRYQPHLPTVLNGLTLSVAPGTRLGVCGRTGSGKSTLFLASFRMMETTRGAILVDGVDIRTLPLLTIRSRLAIVPQDPLMFSGTVRSNLDFHGTHTDQQLWEALRLAHLKDQVHSLQRGLDEPVHEKGSNFSAGTVQLLCIARVFLGQRRTIFLDECTASVDYQTDAAVQAACREAFDGCTVICIAHRIHTIIDYDLIACLSMGVLAQHASPHELLQEDGIFSRLVQSTGEVSARELRQRAAAAAATRAALNMDPNSVLGVTV